jgi:type II secretory pathway component PulK
MRSRPLPFAPRRGGTILIVTIWIVMVMVAMVLLLAQVMHVEMFCSANEQSSLQAQAVEQGAIQHVLSCVDSLKGQVPTESETPCQAVQVGAGAFWIIHPDFRDDVSLAYGITDEASKLNLNSATPAMLAKLPNMTDEIAACVADWRDADLNASSAGAESEYYASLPNPYRCKNAPLETVEELFLVKGVTKELLFGEDINRNGALDENENDADASEPPDNRDGRLDRGVAPLVTVYSQEENRDANGARRVNVSTGRGQALSELIVKALPVGRANEVLTRARDEGRIRPFSSVLDFYVRTGLKTDEFALLADRMTTSQAATLQGLVNVTTAPRQVLACLPGLDENDAAALVHARAPGAMNLDNIAWVAGVLPASKLAAIGNYITARTCRFSADIVSVAADGRAFRRCRIVVDASSSPPKVIYRQDLTHLGWPLDAAILSALRSGAAIEDAAANDTLAQEGT